MYLAETRFFEYLRANHHLPLQSNETHINVSRFFVSLQIKMICNMNRNNRCLDQGVSSSLLKKIFCFFLIVVPFVLNAQKQITVEDIWTKYLFYPKNVPGYNPVPNGNEYSVVGLAGIMKHSFETGEMTEVALPTLNISTLSDKKLKIEDIDDYSFDNSEQKILLAVQQEDIYRRSTKAYYYVYDKTANQIFPLSDMTKSKQSFATFSNDGSKVAFVRDNNIFVVDLNTKKESQITFDGKRNHVLNGMADWVYEEELSQAQYFTWSPDGTKIAFLRFDESNVKEFAMTLWGELYPDEYQYKYPKAGEDNSVVDVMIYDLNTRQTIRLDFDKNFDGYYPRIYWLPNSIDLITLKMNRHQSHLDFVRYNTLTKQMDVVFTDENKCWLEITDDYYFMNDNKTMMVTSERDGYNHIYKVEFGGKITQLTQGQWDVASIAAVDQKSKLVYYLSNESDVLNRDLYVINFDGKKKKMLTSGDGWNSVSFSSNARYYRNVYSNSQTPSVYTIHKADGKQLRVLEDNAKLKQRMQDYGFSKKELFSFTTEEGVSLNGWMLKPLNFDANKKYPVLMYVYGGPGSQEVDNAYSRAQDFAWYQMLTQKGYIVVCVDGRGTNARGDEFRKCVYKNMGHYEAIDQISTAKYLKTLPYVDSDRVGIWGWSFGGYLSALSAFKSGKTFKMAISVAPVTNWRYYDNIYTERFLQTPQENPDGYDQNSPITFAKDLDTKYLLIHGTADDNVHFQNAMDLVTALNKAGKQYDQFFYPNKNHFIMGGNTRAHLYTKLTNYILENL